MGPDKLFEVILDNPDQAVSSWTAFNIAISKKNPAISEEGYYPTILAQASDMSTIYYTVLDTMNKLMYRLKQRMSYLHLMNPYILRQRKYNGECQINSNTFSFYLEDSVHHGVSSCHWQTI